MSKGNNIYKGTFSYAEVFNWLDNTTDDEKDELLLSLGMGEKDISDIHDLIVEINMTQEDRFYHAMQKFAKRGESV